jgi:hypothetical protein
MSAPSSAGPAGPEHPSDPAASEAASRNEAAIAPSRPWYARLWSALRSRFARQIALAAVVAGAIAAGGHFVGGLVGWWHAYELTFGGHDAGKPEARSEPSKVAAAQLSIVVLPFANDGAAEDGWFAEAFDDTAKAIALSPLADDLGNSQGRMSWLSYAQGRHAEAVNWGRKSVASATGNPVWGATLAAALVRTGQPELGRQALSEVLERRPDLSVGMLEKLIPQGRGPKFAAARDDLVAALREIGLE